MEVKTLNFWAVRIQTPDRAGQCPDKFHKDREMAEQKTVKIQHMTMQMGSKG